MPQGGLQMNITAFVLFAVATAALCLLTAIEGIGLFRHAGETGRATAIITDILAVDTETGKGKSQRAAVRYQVNGQTLLSENRVSVPTTAQKGDKLPICYLKERPRRLYIRTKTRLMVMGLGAVICAALSWYFYSR